MEVGVGGLGGVLRAIDYKTGKTVWQRKTGNGAQGLLSTAGNLLFGSDGYDNFIAFDAKTGEPLWHAGLLSNPSNAGSGRISLHVRVAGIASATQLSGKPAVTLCPRQESA